MKTASPTVIPDDQLWQMSLAGDQQAFGRIVERYQALVCALAYSACGNLARSEDLAQDTFLAAWQKLGDLREPAKLRAWLCGIVRTLAANASRREERRGGPDQSLEGVAEPATTEADPAEQAVSREEETILWRSLAELPENYREPMVLFYRQGQSVAGVAAALELSEDAVKQRLSRGRTMLRDELAGVIESTLARSRPGPAFTLAVLVALPVVATTATTASAAVVTVAISTGTVAISTGTAAGGTAATAGKGLLAKLGLGAVAGPVIGLVSAYLGTQAAASTARSPEERALVLRYARRIAAYCFVLSLGLAGVLLGAGSTYTPSAGWVISGVCAWGVALAAGIVLPCRRLEREVRRIREQTRTTDAAHAERLAADGRVLSLPRYRESGPRLLGLPLFAMAWGGQTSVEHRARPVCAWIAVGDIAISPFIALGGVAVAPIALGAFTFGVLSLSIFWGVAFGVFALGSLAIGWWALGCVAVGVECAVGFAALARDYAVGAVASAQEGGTAAAKAWVQTQWLPEMGGVLLAQWPWLVLGSLVFALALRSWRNPERPPT